MTQSKTYADAEYLRVVGEILGPLKQRSFECMQIAPGSRLLDVGCGSGIDTVSMARLSGTSGHVVGVDSDPGMLVAADARAKQAGVSGSVRHQQADATRLPFEDQSFDACRSERLFQHLSAPDDALAEMVRVTRSGGRVVVLDTDWGTVSVDVPEVDIERRLMRFFADRMLHNGYSGRRLHRLFSSAGLTEVSVEAFPVPLVGATLMRQILHADKLEAQALAERVVTDEELRRWGAALADADAAGGCYFCATLMLARGVRSSLA